MTQKIVFEQPLNERVRMFLRIDRLIQRFAHYIHGETVWDTHCALVTLLELADLAARGDLKSELMKELERQIKNMEGLSHIPGVDRAHLQRIIDQHRAHVNALHDLTGQPGDQLRSNEFSNSIRQRLSIPGGTCEFDLPAYHYWLSQPVAIRHRTLGSWIEPFQHIHQSVRLILQLIRDSVIPAKLCAAQGFYQQNLEVNPLYPYQLVRIALPSNSPVYPEISGGKHRFAVRFLELPSVESHAAQTSEDIEFELACCAL